MEGVSVSICDGLLVSFKIKGIMDTIKLFHMVSKFPLHDSIWYVLTRKVHHVAIYRGDTGQWLLAPMELELGICQFSRFDEVLNKLGMKQVQHVMVGFMFSQSWDASKVIVVYARSTLSYAKVGAWPRWLAHQAPGMHAVLFDCEQFWNILTWIFCKKLR